MLADVDRIRGIGWRSRNSCANKQAKQHVLVLEAIKPCEGRHPLRVKDRDFFAEPQRLADRKSIGLTCGEIDGTACKRRDAVLGVNGDRPVQSS